VRNFTNKFQAVSTFVKDWTKITGILNKDPYAFLRVFPSKLVKHLRQQTVIDASRNEKYITFRVTFYLSEVIK
jgi:hypothetical protein